MEYKAVIFDLDGTLIDSLEDIAISGNNILKKHAFPVYPVEEYKQFVGDGVLKLIERMLPGDKRTDDFINQVALEFKTEYNNNCDQTSKMFDGIEQMLFELRNSGILLAVLSNKADDLTQRCGQELLPIDCFYLVRGHKDNEPRKPDPKTALEMVKDMDVQPSETIFVGDMDTDINTALNAGFLPVGVSWGLRSKDYLVKCGAKHVIDEPVQLMDVVVA